MRHSWHSMEYVCYHTLQNLVFPSSTYEPTYKPNRTKYLVFQPDWRLLRTKRWWQYLDIKDKKWKDDGLNYINGQFRTSLTCGVSTGTRLRTGRSRVLNTAWEEIISFPNVRTGSEVHPASNAMRTGVLSRGISGRGVWLATQLHLEPRLRMRTAIPPHRLYAFLAGTGTNLPFIN